MSMQRVSRGFCDNFSRFASGLKSASRDQFFVGIVFKNFDEYFECFIFIIWIMLSRSVLGILG